MYNTLTNIRMHLALSLRENQRTKVRAQLCPLIQLIHNVKIYLDVCVPIIPLRQIGARHTFITTGLPQFNFSMTLFTN